MNPVHHLLPSLLMQISYPARITSYASLAATNRGGCVAPSQQPVANRRQKPIAGQVAARPMATYTGCHAATRIEVGNGLATFSQDAPVEINRQAPLRVEKRPSNFRSVKCLIVYYL